MFKLMKRTLVYGFRSEIAQSLSKNIDLSQPNLLSERRTSLVLGQADLDVE